MNELFEALSAKIGADVFTEELQTELKAQLEVEINEKVKAAVTEKEAELEEQTRTKIAEFTTEMVERVNEYLDHSAAEFYERNQVAIASEQRVEAADRVLEAIAGVFKESFVEIPEERRDLYEEAVAAAETAKTELNEALARQIELSKQRDELERSVKFMEMTEGLTDIDTEKVLGIMEGLEISSLEDFQAKVKIAIDKVKSETITESTDAEDMDDLGEEVTSYDIDRYL